MKPCSLSRIVYTTSLLGRGRETSELGHGDFENQQSHERKGRTEGVGVAVTCLVERADARLEDHVGVEEEGAQERLRVAGQLGDDADEKQVDVQRVLQHVLQL